ncbi:MAG: hypothetical protein AAF674_00420 [Pseudomonadota bacterium]
MTGLMGRSVPTVDQDLWGWLARVVLGMCLLAVMLTGTAHADQERAQRLYDISGMEAVVESLPGDLSDAIQEGWVSDRGMGTEVDLLIETYFGTDKMRRMLLGALATGMTPEDMDTVIAGLETEVGLRATQLETEAAAIDYDTVVARGGALYRALEEDGDPRVALYQRFVTSTNSVDLSVIFGMNVAYALLSGAMGSPDLPRALSDDEILAIVNSLEPQIRAEAIRFINALTAVTYGALTLAELEEYIAFLETEPVESFYEVTVKALQFFLVQNMRDFGHELMQLTGARRT